MNMDSESFYFIMLLFLFRGDKKSTSRTKQLRVVSGQERRGTTLVGLSDIPRYLRSGFLYESYNHNESDDEVCRKFDVPLNCLKKNTTVTSVQDLQDLCSSVRYTGSSTFLTTIQTSSVSHLQKRIEPVSVKCAVSFRTRFRTSGSFEVCWKATKTRWH